MKHINILFILMLLSYSCKTPETLIDPTLGKSLEMQPETNELKETKELDPVDLKSLFKQMALTQDKEDQFMSIYRLTAKSIAEVKSLNLDQKEDRIRISKINTARDVKVKAILDSSQKIMYDKYIRNLAKRKIMNQSNGKEINY